MDITVIFERMYPYTCRQEEGSSYQQWDGPEIKNWLSPRNQHKGQNGLAICTWKSNTRDLRCEINT